MSYHDCWDLYRGHIVVDSNEIDYGRVWGALNFSPMESRAADKVVDFFLSYNSNQRDVKGYQTRKRITESSQSPSIVKRLESEGVLEIHKKLIRAYERRMSGSEFFRMLDHPQALLRLNFCRLYELEQRN